MNKNLLRFELINLIQGSEALGIQGIWRRLFKEKSRLVV